MKNKKMTKNLVWRMGTLPTVTELCELVREKYITKQEALDMMFRNDENDVKSLKEEIKFLKQVIEKLGDNKKIVEIIKLYEQPKVWYGPYRDWTYCMNAVNTSGGVAGSINAVYTSTTSGSNLLVLNGSASATAQGTTHSNVGIPQKKFSEI